MKTLLFSLVLSGLCHAQAFNGIHAPVSRSVTIPADEASFNIMVTARLDSTAKQVKEALQAAGAPNPTVVATGFGRSSRPSILGGGPELVYSATFTLPAASAAEVAKGLLNLSANLTEPLTAVQLSVTYAASETKVEAMRQSLLPQLRDESLKTAQAIAAAAGLKLGRIRAVNEAPSAGLYLAARNGDFSRIGAFLSPVPFSVPYTFRLELVFDTLP